MDYATVCYDTAGDQKWVQRYNHSTGIGPVDIPNAIFITDDGAVVVTGQSQEEGSSGKFDYATLKYDLETGSQIWLERWNGPQQTHDYGKSATVGSNGAIYVTGQCNGPGSAFDWGTIKYSMATDLEETNNDIPSSFKLFQNYPNPFHSVTAIRYSLPEEGFVMLTLYNMFGEEITKLVNKMQQAGSYSVDFDGSGLTSGAYYCRLQCEKHFQISKMILIK